MKVQVHESQLEYFRRKARSTPNEIMALLLGRSSRHEVIVDAFIYPPLRLSTPGAVDISPQDVQDVYDAAKAQGLRVVGDIHTHPNAAPVMSETDYCNHKNCGNIVSGIVEVTNRRTRVVFWQDGSPLPCTLEYI